MFALRAQSRYLMIPAALFLGGDLLLLVGGLLFPSFAAIRQTYNFTTLDAPMLFAVGAVAGFAAARRAPVCCAASGEARLR